jgi:ribosomal protein S18 acetylase RimI-like enzyme
MSDATIEIRVLGKGETAILDHVADGVFDLPIHPRWTAEFFADPRHHLAVAIHDGVVVGMASGVHYVHPDKPPELFLNEVGVAPTHEGRGIGRRLLATLFDHARSLGCVQAWVGTDRDNAGAQRLYRAAGSAEPPEEFLLFNFRF